MPKFLDNLIITNNNQNYQVKPLYYYNLTVTFSDKGEVKTTKLGTAWCSIVSSVDLTDLSTQAILESLFSEAKLSSIRTYYFNGTGYMNFISSATYKEIFGVNVTRVASSTTTWRVEYYVEVDGNTPQVQTITIDTTDIYKGMLSFSINNKIPLFPEIT